MVEIDFTALIFLPTFLLFLALMKAVFFDRVSATIKERDKNVAINKEKTDAFINKAESKVSNYEDDLAEARKKANEILSKANAEAQSSRKDLLAEADADVKEKRFSELAALEDEKNKTINNLSSTIKEITGLMVGKILDQEVSLDLSEEKIQSAFKNGNVNSVKKQMELSV